MTTTASTLSVAPGSIVVVRDEEWLVTSVEQSRDGALLSVKGLTELVRDTDAMFYEGLDRIEVLDPAEATVVGDTVGDPYKDTSSVALNPVIKFTTLFGLLAVELAVAISAQEGGGTITLVLAVLFFLASVYFVWRSFYGMRIGEDISEVHIDRYPESIESV